MSRKNVNENGLVVVSLFDGISCAQLSLERSGVPVAKYISSEIKKVAIKTTKRNYPNTIMVGDVTALHYQRRTKTLYANCKRKVIDSLSNHKGKNEWTKEELKKFSKRSYQVCPNGEVVKWTFGDVVHQGEVDLLIGGSPCQGFSSAFHYCQNPNAGLRHIQSKLFYEYLRLLKEIKPKYFLLENVKMANKDKKALNEYLKVDGICINSSLLTMQNRDRCYWSNIKGITIPQDANIDFQDYKLTTIPRVEPMLYAQRFEDDTTPLNLTKEEIDFICNNNLWAYEELKAVTPTLTKEEFVDELHEMLKESLAKKTPFRKRIWKDGLCDGKNFTCYNITNEKKVHTITRKCDRSPNSGAIAHGDFYRYLTKLEVCKAQTIPYSYLSDLSFSGIQDVCGDGFSIDVICHILKSMK